MPAPKGNKFAVGNKGGRPSKYHPEYAEQARKICRLGAVNAELADFFGVDVVTIHRWSRAHPEFSRALRIGKDEADEPVVGALFKRAVGFDYTAERFIRRGRADNRP